MTESPLEAWTPPEKEGKLVTSLFVNNSLAGRKVEFVPSEGNVVRWYGCGPTVYDAAHMGHARTYIAFDVIRRIMEGYFGYDVKMCMNITDIDDKIIQKSIDSNMSFEEVARHWENEFFKDMRELNCMLPHSITRVSEYVPENVAFIERIVANGFAYESEGSVFFDIQAFQAAKKHVYGRMEPQSVSDASKVLEGEGALGQKDDFGKRCSLDFALWKKAKAGEPSWPSPWGEGRPGWHIECSTMASQILGFPLDIHSGGVDLRFPHHDNELAQTEAAFDKPGWVKYFLHSGHLHIQGAKMSKSLKNFITIGAMLEEFSPRVVRLLTISHRWDAPMNYNPDGTSMKEPAELDKAFGNFFANLRSQLREIESLTRSPTSKNEGLSASQKWREQEKALDVKFDEARRKTHKALCNNFDTPVVLEQMQQLMTAVYKYNQEVGMSSARGPLLRAIAGWLFGMCTTFGLTNGSPATLDYTESLQGSGAEVPAGVMDTLANFRLAIKTEARKLHKEGETPALKEMAGRILSQCDTIRDVDLIRDGIVLEDKGDTEFFWKCSTEQQILAERSRKQKEDEAKSAQKLANKQAQEAAEAAKQEKLSTPPLEYFKKYHGEEYSQYDEEGLPTMKAAGEPVSKSLRDKLKKLLDKHRTAHDQYMASK